MALALVFSGMLGVGLWLIVMGQPLGRPRPDLALRLQMMSAQGRLEMEARGRRRGAALFKSSALERLLRPLLEDAGAFLDRTLSRAGIRTANLERRLALGWPGMTASQFYGQKLASGLVFLALFPLMNVLRVHPLGAWPVWIWLGGVVLGVPPPDLGRG